MRRRVIVFKWPRVKNRRRPTVTRAANSDTSLPPSPPLPEFERLASANSIRIIRRSMRVFPNMFFLFPNSSYFRSGNSWVDS